MAQNFDALNAGVKPGGLRNRGEIRMLLCYLLDKIGQPVSGETLARVLQENGLANYFETMDAVNELVKNGNLATVPVDPSAANGEEGVVLTDRGRGAIDILASDLPATVRETAVRTTLRYLTKERNARDNDARIEEVDDGYQVTFTMADRGTTLMELSIYAATRDEAETLKTNFTDDPVRVYSAILAALMAD